MDGEDQQRQGAVYALLAYSAWGFVVVYWKWVEAIPQAELMAHRILWTLVLAVGIEVFRGEVAPGLQILRDRARLPILAASSMLLVANWSIFVWAVANDQVLATSLGYYIAPLVNVLLGSLLLGETLTFRQTIAVVLAAVGVAQLAWQVDGATWIPVGLAGSFGVYGFLRKTRPAPPIMGLALEMMFPIPFALGYLVWLAAQGESAVLDGVTGAPWVVFAGVVTLFPLGFFGAAAARLRLSTLGVFQYLAPSITFVLGVFVYGEPFDRTRLVAFGLVWVALLLYTWDEFRSSR